jgi:hypothetical protein
MQEVLALRSEYGRPQKKLRNEKKYQNASYYRLALAAPS